MAQFFFFAGRGLEETEIIDKIAHRYGWTIREINDLDAGMLYRLVLRIMKEEVRQQSWDLYLKHFHFMIAGQLKFEAFESYYGRISGTDIDTRPAEEIIAEVEEIKKQFAEGGGKN